jgi:pyrophosphatase PpaX
VISLKKINTIIYDLDGTLIDTNDIIVRSFQSTFKRHFPNLSLSIQTIHSFIGPTLEDTFSKYTNDPFIIQEMIRSYREFYVKYEVGSHQLYPGVLEVLNKLKKQGYQLAVLTSKFKEAAWPSFTHYKLEQLFDVFVGLDDVKNPKPHPDAVKEVLKRFPGYNGAIMIGDNQGDILAGKNAGIYSAGVAWSLKGPEHLIKVEPDFMLQDMNDIFRIIKEIEED